MDDPDQVTSYVKAYAWGGPTSALQLHHLRELSRLIRPGDTVLDLACGPGPLLLELAPLFKDSHFIGVDLSNGMLEYLRQAVLERDLDNVSVIQEDIRTLPSLVDSSVNLVISTSALHHLSDEDALRDVFRRISSLLKKDGGFYLFDFGLLKSAEARRLFVAEVARLASPVTARDYDLSLQAAFPISTVSDLARRELPKPHRFATSAFVDFFYFLQTQPRGFPTNAVEAYLDRVRRSLALPMRVEYLMLRWLRRTRHVD